MTHQIDVDATLGPTYLAKHAALPKAKPDRPEPRKKDDEGGDAAPAADKGDKPAGDKPEGGDKPDKPAGD